MTTGRLTAAGLERLAALASALTPQGVAQLGRLNGEGVGDLLAAIPEVIRLARAGVAFDVRPGERCSRCHHHAPNPDGCAVCNVPRLGERLTQAQADRDAAKQAAADLKRAVARLVTAQEKYDEACKDESRTDAARWSEAAAEREDAIVALHTLWAAT